MPMTPAQILAAVQASPALVAFAHQTPPDTTSIATALSVGRTVAGSVATGTLLGWTASTGMQAIIYDTAYTSGSAFYATPLRSAALSMLAAQQSGLPLDLSASATGQGNLALLGDWVTAGALSAADLTALQAMAAVPDPVSELQVRAAISDVYGTLLV